MKTFRAYLAETTSPSKPSTGVSRKAFIQSLRYYSEPIPEPDDLDYDTILVPLTKIVTRERGKRYDLSKLVTAYQTQSGSIPPPLVDKGYRSDGKYLVIDGHHRVKAAKLAGLTAIWVNAAGHRHNRGSHQRCVCGHDRRTHSGSLIFDDGFGDFRFCSI